MISKRNFLLVFFCFSLTIFLQLSAKETEQQIDAIILVDTRSNLKKSVRKDGQLMASLLQSVADATHMHLNIQILEGNQVYVANLQSWIDSLKGRPHDVILFYFSGHGCKSATGCVPWPDLLFSAKSGMLLSMASVIKAIEAQQSRLSIVLSDCCNGALGQKNLFGFLGGDPVRHKVNIKDFSLGASILFKTAQGHIRATASVPGQNALAMYNGSLFTIALKQSLTKNCFSNAPSWKGVFHSASSLCNGFQKPYVSLELR